MQRKQEKYILHDLRKKMVFLIGPRQVGKTWLAKKIAKNFNPTLYLNYDNLDDRKIIKNQEWLPHTELIIFDEIHKMPKWKNFIKGIYDTKPDNQKLIVTGSAGLDLFKQAGDSLAGRYFLHHLLPFSLAELNGLTEKNNIHHYLERGGFPEPFLEESKREADRWRLQYIDGIIRTDIMNLESLYSYKSIHLILSLLRKKVGSPISYQSIAEDIGTSLNTVKKYIQLLEALYIIFRVIPFSKNIARSLLKEPKIYFFDIGLVEGDEGARFENFVALSLLKHVYGKRDYEGIPAELHYLKTKDGQEVDFCVTSHENPEVMLEVKVSDKEIHKGLFYFHSRYGIEGKQLVLHLAHEKQIKDLEIVKAEDYLKTLFL